MKQMTEDEYRQWRIGATRKRAMAIHSGTLKSDPKLGSLIRVVSGGVSNG